MTLTALALCAGMCLAASAPLQLEDTGSSLVVREGGQPVLEYRYTPVSPPAGVEARYQRLGYIHPLYGLDGEVLTQDFPKDHYHHRGVFWAWPDSTIGEQRIDVWALDGARETHEAWLEREIRDGAAHIGVQNAWVLDAAPTQARVRESVWFTVHPAVKNSRAIDFRIVFENVSQEPFVLRGATTDNKGYGGFSFRPDAERKPMYFTCATGSPKEDVLRVETPWADVSFAQARGSKKQSGVAIFQHPSNPGYPHPGWILRNYGFLGACWPHTEPQTLAPGEKVELKYRLLVHRGTARKAGVAKAFAAYAREQAAQP